MRKSFSLLLPVVLIGTSLMKACNTPVSESDPVPKEDISTQEFQDSVPVYSKSYITGKFEPAIHPDFVRIRPEHADRADRYMRADAYAAFCAMYDAALKEGVHLKIISAARNFDKQKAIWESKWTGNTLVEGGINLSEMVSDTVERALRILRYSSMPGTSRHHWGTDIDLNHLENSWFDKGEGLKIYTWLKTHAGSYGFCQPYTVKGTDRTDGYEEEKWHWSWMPVAQQLTTLVASSMNDQDIGGFKGDGTATEIGVVQRYMLGISTVCR